MGTKHAASPLDALGLHNRVNRIDRVVTNVSDLAASTKAFWEAVAPSAPTPGPNRRGGERSGTLGSRAAGSTAISSATLAASSSSQCIWWSGRLPSQLA